MRHVGSLIAGMFIAPIAWLLIALGQQESTKTVAKWVERGAFDSVDLIAPAAYLLGAGLIIGLIATLRISPVGPIVAGLALLGTYVSLFIDPLSALNSLPADQKIAGLTINLQLPIVNGTTAVLGLALLVAAASVKRWRAWPVAAPVSAGGETGRVDPHEFPLGQGPKTAPQFATRTPYGDRPPTSEFPSAGAGATSVLPAYGSTAPPVPTSGAPAGGFGHGLGSDATQPVSMRPGSTQPGPPPGPPPLGSTQPMRAGAGFPPPTSAPPAPPVSSAPPKSFGPPVASAPASSAGPGFAGPGSAAVPRSAPVSGSAAGPFAAPGSYAPPVASAPPVSSGPAFPPPPGAAGQPMSGPPATGQFGVQPPAAGRPGQQPGPAPVSAPAGSQPPWLTPDSTTPPAPATQSVPATPATPPGPFPPSLGGRGGPQQPVAVPGPYPPGSAPRPGAAPQFQPPAGTGPMSAPPAPPTATRPASAPPAPQFGPGAGTGQASAPPFASPTGNRPASAPPAPQFGPPAGAHPMSAPPAPQFGPPAGSHPASAPPAPQFGPGAGTGQASAPPFVPPTGNRPASAPPAPQFGPPAGAHPTSAPPAPQFGVGPASAPLAGGQDAPPLRAASAEAPPATPWSGAPGGLTEEVTAMGELPTRPATEPTTPPAPYGGGHAARAAAETAAPGVPQTRYGRPSAGASTTEPSGATQQEATGAPVVPPVSETSAQSGPVAGAGGALPSRAARTGDHQETSLLAGPSFDGFSAGRRGVREEETEAFHPGRQAPVPSRPRHAAEGETGEHPIMPRGQEPAEAEEATQRFTPMRATDPVAGTGADEEATTRIGSVDPDVTTRIGAPSAAEQAERRAAFARGEAERRAKAQAELDRRASGNDEGGDEPPTSPWAAPPAGR